MSASSWVHLTVERIAKETDAAFLLVVDGQELWIPKSQISDPADYEEGDEDCEISVTEWIAKEKGIE